MTRKRKRDCLRDKNNGNNNLYKQIICVYKITKRLFYMKGVKVIDDNIQVIISNDI